MMNYMNYSNSFSAPVISPDKLPLVLSVLEVASILHIGKNMAYDLVNSGAIRCVRVGRCIRVPRSALLEYLNGESA